MNEKRQVDRSLEHADALATKRDRVESCLEHDVLRAAAVDQDPTHSAELPEINIGRVLWIRRRTLREHRQGGEKVSGAPKGRRHERVDHWVRERSTAPSRAQPPAFGRG